MVWSGTCCAVLHAKFGVKSVYLRECTEQIHDPFHLGGDTFSLDSN